MDYLINIATLNLNSINTDINKSLFKDFVINHDVDIMFLQEVAFENFSFLSSYNALINISEDKKGTGILLRKNFNYSSQIFDASGKDYFRYSEWDKFYKYLCPLGN